MDKSLDEIIGSAKPAATSSSSGPGPKGVSKGRRSRRSKPAAAKGSAPVQRGFKAVVIRNLSDTISEDDIRDLFRQVGPVVRVHVERDDRGDRTGMAWVLFDFAEDAVVAAERFNQRKAAGQTISVRRVAHIGDTGAGLGSLGDRIGAGSSGSAPNGSNSSKSKRRRGGRNGDKKNKQPPKSRNAADLDAELDAYMQVESTVPEGAGSSAAGPVSTEPTQSQPQVEESMIDV